jgi:hypothetical protein
MENYIVFDSRIEVVEANGRWLLARYQAGVRDCRCGVPVDPQITSAHSWGKTMLNGKIACPVPEQWKVEFIGTTGVETELTEDDFPKSEEVI